MEFLEHDLDCLVLFILLSYLDIYLETLNQQLLTSKL